MPSKPLQGLPTSVDTEKALLGGAWSMRINLNRWTGRVPESCWPWWKNEAKPKRSQDDSGGALPRH
jgi:hypothetical protein